MGFFSSSSKADAPEPGSPEERARWIRNAREDHADAQERGSRPERAHTAAVLHALTEMASPDEVEQGYAAPLRPRWRR